ncbi:MAG: chromate transporter, partial [Firmicutes bacterium]|nr:chromate transporter [Bacillota bacterium]
SVGGGLATLPFLYEMADKTGWFTAHDISTMIAVSESTPGPIGINMASYVGCTTGGFAGSIAATLGLVSPSVIIIVIVAHYLKKFKENKYVKAAFYGLRPTATALIAAAGVGIVKIAFFSEKISPDGFFWQGAILAAVVFVTIKKFNLHPIIYIAASAVIGVIFKMQV